MIILSCVMAAKAQQSVSLNFDELADGTFIGSIYALQGVVFDNATIDGRPQYAPSQPNSIFALPLQGPPLTFHFPTGARQVSIQCDRDGFTSTRQPQMRVFDKNGNLLTTQYCDGPLTLLSYVAPSNTPISTVQTGATVSYLGNTFVSSDDWDNLSFTLTAGPSAPTITAVKMFDSHTLQVDVIGQFSPNPSTQKTIQVNTVLSGIPLVSIFPLTPSAVGSQPKSLFIDLATNGVPRFTDNQIFDVTATAIEAGIPSTITKTGNEIPLPVVYVHGVLTDCLPDRIPTQLFQDLQTAHPAYVSGTDLGFPQLTANYPTLVAFDYHSLNGSAVDFARELNTWVNSTLLNPVNGRTYANKVNIVAHSLGGIVSRTAISMNNGGAWINKLILVGSPSEGATIAPIVLNNWNLVQGIVGALSLTPVAFKPSLSSALSCVFGAPRTTTEEMLPTYGWWANAKALAGQGLLQIPLSSQNSFLAQVNSALDSRVAYYAIVADGVSTPTILWGRLWVFPPPPFPGGVTPAAVYDSAAWGPGDGIVPIRSQTGADTGWVLGAGRGQLFVFANMGAVFHTDYFKPPSLANQSIGIILWR